MNIKPKLTSPKILFPKTSQTPLVMMGQSINVQFQSTYMSVYFGKVGYMIKCGKVLLC